MAKEEYMAMGNINPDFQNYSNVLFVQWQELNNATTELVTCKRTEELIYLNTFKKCFVRFFGQINDTSKLGHLSEEKRRYVIYYYKNLSRIKDKYVARKINEILRQLLSDYGLFNLESYGNDEIW